MDIKAHPRLCPNHRGSSLSAFRITALATEKCPGCRKWFSSSRHSKHLAQTQKPACAAIRTSHFYQSPLPSSPPFDATSPVPVQLPQIEDVDMDAEPMPFEGDFFGDYDAHYFENEDEDEDEDERASGPLTSDEETDEELNEIRDRRRSGVGATVKRSQSVPKA
ncbi:hypothetical protein BD309DRAFT_985052, partial [Dichomitus squalens]